MWKYCEKRKVFRLALKDDRAVEQCLRYRNYSPHHPPPPSPVHTLTHTEVRGHSPSRLTCTSAPTFGLDCCVFQWVLDCDSCLSDVWRIQSCSGGHGMPLRCLVFSCFGFFCCLGLVFSTVWCSHHCVHLDRRTGTCKVTTSTPVRLAEKSAVSLFLYTTRTMNCCQLEKEKRKNLKENDC